MDDRLLRTLRSQSWERAKGELNSMLHTYYDGGLEPDSQFVLMESAIKNFISEVEDNDLHC